MNKSARLKRSLAATAIAACTLYASAWRAEADFIQTNLVSDIPGLASITDPMLVNPWGMSHTATSPIWTSNQGTNTATLYGVTGNNGVAKVNVAPNGFVAIHHREGPARLARSPIQTLRPSRWVTAAMASSLTLSLPI
jgi:hypothetical protein